MASKRFWIIKWGPAPGNRQDGHDLVYASDRSEAIRIYRRNHYSPIWFVIVEGGRSPNQWYFESVSKSDRSKAIKNGIVNLESGT